MNVTEPPSSGIGGDAFCLFYDSKTKKITGINGSGRSPLALTLERARKDLGLSPAVPDGEGGIPMSHVHSVTVPGAAAAWVDVVQTFGSGKLSLADVFDEGIRLASEGAPISLISSIMWENEVQHLKSASPNYDELLKRGRAPGEGEIMRMPGLAEALRLLARYGKKGFYEGPVAEAIVEVVKARGGVLEMEDLRRHGEAGSEIVEPVCVEYGGYKLWECGPNGQGLVALMTLEILENLQKTGVIPEIGKGGAGWEHNSSECVSFLSAF